MGLRLELNNLIKARGYITYQEVEDYCRDNFYKTETATRRLRKSESSMVEAVKGKKQSGGKAIIGYKWIGLSENEEYTTNEPIPTLNQSTEPLTASQRSTWEES